MTTLAELRSRRTKAETVCHVRVCWMLNHDFTPFHSATVKIQGRHDSEPALDAFWRTLYEHDADVVLSGHDHVYERFAPQRPNGAPDPARGIRQFVVGTGGDSHRKFTGPTVANSEVRNDDTFGVLKLTLHPTSYEWQFIPVAGQSFTDSGTGQCH